MQSPLSKVLLKIFANGFYRVHGGFLFFMFLVLFGLVEPNQLLSYHKALMLAFITSGLMMVVVFLLWLAYMLKAAHYMVGQLFGQTQAFLFYSSTANTRQQQFKAWFTVNVAVALPVLVYGSVSAVVAITAGFLLQGLGIIAYMLALLCAGAWFCTFMANRLIGGSKQSIILRLTKTWAKPYFSLYIYHVFNKLKLNWFISKVLSYLIITGVFMLFADVSHDTRVAAIAMLAISVAHAVLVFEERKFQEVYLVFARNLPYNRVKLFLSFAAVYAILLLPEAVWLLGRYPIPMAIGLLAFGLSMILLYHSLLYRLSFDMEKYLTSVMGLFIGVFILVLFKIIWLLTLVILMVAGLLFYINYYKNPGYEAESE